MKSEFTRAPEWLLLCTERKSYPHAPQSDHRPLAPRSAQWPARDHPPDQIAEPGVDRPDWPRPDLNLACLEMLIGLVYLACPPRDVSDWRAHRADPETLRKALAPLASAFNLTGEGPLFLQDMERLEGGANAPDMLFIDSAGKSTAKKNADLMVKRDRYAGLPLPLAAMALYTLQSHAPEGGRGNRTPCAEAGRW